MIEYLDGKIYTGVGFSEELNRELKKEFGHDYLRVKYLE